MSTSKARACWLNCFGPDDARYLAHKDIAVIDAMEDAMSPLDETARQLRQLITRFEACYHEADREAAYIIESITAGHCLGRSQQRPAQRQIELDNARDILQMWCDDPKADLTHSVLSVGDVPATDLCRAMGEPSPLKTWQVERVIDRISQALDQDHVYHNMALDIGEYGEKLDTPEHAQTRAESDFVQQTRDTLIHDTADGKASKVSLAFAIDLMMPCSWDFVGCLTTILAAIGGNCHPDRPVACCARNIKLSPLCDRLSVIASTLQTFWTHHAAAGPIDDSILAQLGTRTPVKRWLCASLDKTIRLHLTLPWDMELF